MSDAPAVLQPDAAAPAGFNRGLLGAVGHQDKQGRGEHVLATKPSHAWHSRPVCVHVVAEHIPPAGLAAARRP